MICIIPARSGSQRIPRKNIKDFHGIPILAYSIKTAKESGLFDRIIVSTDDDDIWEEALYYGAEAYIRPTELGENDVGTQEVARNVLTSLPISDEYTCVLYPCSPLLTADDLIHGYGWMLTCDDFEYVYSTDKEGVDCGNYYFGRTQAFLDKIPLEGNSFHVPLEYACDINTESDWIRAEQLYLRRYGHKETMER